MCLALIMAGVQYNSKAEFVRKAQALSFNITAATSLQDVLRTKISVRRALSRCWLVGRAKLTKDGDVFLREMQIQHPTAAIMAQAATTQLDIMEDGTISSVLLIGELLRQADRCIVEGVNHSLTTLP
jgi:T-complex protein 1 subunit zeta